jgi:hypothetical protein
MQDFDHELSGRLSFNHKTFLKKFYLAIEIGNAVWNFGGDFWVESLQYDCTADYLEYLKHIR